MSNVENLFVTLDSRVCGNPHGLIRKYALMCCRQCFRSNAKEIGFIKPLLSSPLNSRWTLLPSKSWCDGKSGDSVSSYSLRVKFLMR
ncbi:unnamed protein product [Prunus brigantina]